MVLGESSLIAFALVMPIVKARQHQPRLVISSQGFVAGYTAPLYSLRGSGAV